MKKFISLWMFVFVCCLLMSSKNASAGAAYATNFDWYSLGSVSGQDSWTSVSGSLTVSDTTSYSGSQSLRAYRSAMYGDSDVASMGTRVLSGNDSTDDTVSFWYKPTNIWVGVNNCNLSLILTTSKTDGTQYAGYYVGVRPLSSTTGKLVLNSSNCASGTEVGDIAINTWYFVEVKFDFTAHTYKARIDGGSWSSTVSISSTHTKILKVGNALYSRSQTYYIDDLAVGPLGSGTTTQLTITLNPQAGGMVSSSPEGLSCIDDLCQGDFSPENVSVTATPSTDWAFAYWDDGTTNLYDNPLTVMMNGDKSLMAMFFKTFRASVGSFRANIDDNGGQCVPYVRYETDIPWDDFNGDAASTYQQAIDAGYATSTTAPRISSIIVFAAQSGMPYGHVGIVTAIDGSNITIRDSNWNLDEKVDEHTVDVSSYTITGYIYYTP